MNSTRMFCGGGERGGGRCRVGGRGEEASARAGEGCAVLSGRAPGRGPPRHWPCCGAAGPPPAAAPGRASPRSYPPLPPCLPCRPRAAAAPRRTARPAARRRARCRRAAASHPHRSCGRTCRAEWKRRGPRGRGVGGVRGVRAGWWRAICQHPARAPVPLPRLQPRPRKKPESVSRAWHCVAGSCSSLSRARHSAKSLRATGRSRSAGMEATFVWIHSALTLRQKSSVQPDAPMSSPRQSASYVVTTFSLR